VIPGVVRERLNIWLRQHKKWIALHYIFGGAAVAGSTIAAAIANSGWTEWQIAFSTIAAISAGLITLTKPADRAGNAIRAWALLDKAANRYRFDPEYPIQGVLDALAQGEHVNQGSRFSAADA
jgi:hypothetical protein